MTFPAPRNDSPTEPGPVRVLTRSALRAEVGDQSAADALDLLRAHLEALSN